MDHQLHEIAENLEILITDAPEKVQIQLTKVLAKFKKTTQKKDFITIQEELELISNNNQLDSYTRNEIMNLVTQLEDFF